MRHIGRRRPKDSTPPAGRIGRQAFGRRVAGWMLIAVSLVTIGSTTVVVCGLAIGYRPVVILTGSMGDTAPPGSLIVAEPRSAARIDVGDIVVMRQPGEPLITHRVIEIETNGSSRFAITQGDANEAPDAAPYPLDGEQLVARWIHPELGRWALTIFQPGPALAVVAVATVVIAIQALRRIWSAPAPASIQTGRTPRPASDRSRTAPRRPRRRRAAVLGVAPLAAISGLGLAWALFTTNEPVPNNVFGTAACFDPQLGSVQNGETIHAVNGTVNVPITAVDPTSSFVMSSARSSSNEPADSTALVRLAADGSAVEIERSTDNGAPPAVTVAWSVVSYDCGVSVQRGTIAGDGTSSVSDPISTIDPGRSFVLLGSAPGPGDQDFGPDDLVRADLGAGSSVTIESAGAALAADRSYHWQVVSFSDAADAVVQTVDVALGSSTTDNTGSLSTPVNLTSSFVLASVTSNSSGADIGERLVRARLVDATTVEVSRAVGADPVDVRIQVVDLRDGTTVRHGIVDFAPGETVKPITVDPIDTARVSAISSVAVPGPLAGGRSDHVADDVVGEGSATFVVADSTTVTAERVASASNASFAWQLIEWAGPTWWDSGYLFRQRIDVETGAVAAPDAYTVPVEVDHAALVAIDAARADGADVRVVWWDGSAWVELDRVLEDASAWNQADTTLLFRTQTPIAADSVANYWLYFGNAAPAPVLEDPENVFLLVEDFESGGLGDFEDRTAGTSWYSADPWSRRIPITVDSAQVGADLTNFPVLVSLTNATLAAEAQADGSDIRFTAADGVSPLDHEIERFDSGTGTLVAWVRVPTVTSATDTSLFLLFGAANAPDQQAIRTTWDPSAAGVWHLSGDPAGSEPRVDDSTVGNHDGLPVGGMTAVDLVAARIGRGLDFDGVDDRVVTPSIGLGARDALSMSAWVRLDALGSDSVVLTQRSGGTTFFDLSVTAAGAVAATIDTTGSGSVTASGGAVGTGAWHHVAGVWDGALLHVYLDGAEVDQQPATGQLTAPTDGITIGAAAGAGSPLDGIVDEVRLSTVARSAAWIAAEHSSGAAPSSFAAPGGVQSGTWFDVGAWSYRKPLKISADDVSADATDFVFQLAVDDSDVQAGTQVDGDDLVVTAGDGVTRLDHVLENYTAAGGSVRAWVRIPNLSSTVDTDLFLYYGNAAAVNQSDEIGTFGADADLVFLGRS